MQRILKKSVFAYLRDSTTQKLKPRDHRQRHDFVDWVLQYDQIAEEFVKKVIFTHEAHVCLNGYVNKRNCHIRGLENSHRYHSQNTNNTSKKIHCLVWILDLKRVIGPYIFLNALCETVSQW